MISEVCAFSHLDGQVGALKPRKPSRDIRFNGVSECEELDDPWLDSHVNPGARQGPAIHPGTARGPRCLDCLRFRLKARRRGAATRNRVLDARAGGCDTDFRNHWHRRRWRNKWRHTLRWSRRDHEPDHAGCSGHDGECWNPPTHRQSRDPWATQPRLALAARSRRIPIACRIPPCYCRFSGLAS